jgi:hypothetical protein
MEEVQLRFGAVSRSNVAASSLITPSPEAARSISFWWVESFAATKVARREKKVRRGSFIVDVGVDV